MTPHGGLHTSCPLTVTILGPSGTEKPSENLGRGCICSDKKEPGA